MSEPTTTTTTGGPVGEASRGDASGWRKVVARIEARRDSWRQRPATNLAYRIAVGVVGGLVTLLGLALIPYPGPGWLIVIAGLAILASEFRWAKSVLHFVKRYYDRWTDWLGRQSRLVQALVALGVGVIVVLTLWLIGALALVGGWFGFDPSWLASPILG